MTYVIISTSAKAIETLTHLVFLQISKVGYNKALLYYFFVNFHVLFYFSGPQKTKNLIYASGSVAMRTHTLRRICLKKYVKIFLGMFFQQVNNTVSHLSLSTLLFFLVFLHLLTKIKSSLFFILVSIVHIFVF